MVLLSLATLLEDIHDILSSWLPSGTSLPYLCVHRVAHQSPDTT